MTAEEMVTVSVGLDDIQEAHQGLAGVAVRTPLVQVPGATIFLKCEQFQPSGSFKTRGAYTAVRRQLAVGASHGVITYSSGNHAQAVAYAAHQRRVKATLVMPTTAPEIKIRGVERWGGRVVLEGITSEDRRKRAEAIASSEGLTMVRPFDDPDVIAGQGTTGLEILEQCPQAVTVVVPAGGGGLASGIALAVDALSPGTQLIIVEPEGAPTVASALDAGEPVTLESTDSVADGLLPLRVGDLPFEILSSAANVSCVQVTDEDIRTAAAWLFCTMGIAAEPSGAAAYAAISSGRIATEGHVVAVVSGGNVSPLTLAEWA